MTEAALSPRALNRALLARQGLLERSSDPLPRMLERMAGLQAQYAPSMYIGLWSRLEGFERAALTRALEDARGHPGHADAQHDPPRLARRTSGRSPRATREARRTSWLRATRESCRRPPIEAAAETLRAALAGGATLRRKEIEALIGKAEARAVGLWVDLVRAPPSGTWERRRADLYALAEDWIGPAPTSRPTPPPSTSSRRYLGGFGPATAKDVASFTGLAAARPRPASLERLELRRFGELLDLPRRPAARPRHPGAAPLPPDLGREPARPRPPHRRPPRGAPPEDLRTSRRRSRSRPSSSTARSPAPGDTSEGRIDLTPVRAASTPPTAATRRPRPSGSPPSTPNGPYPEDMADAALAPRGYVPRMLDVRRLRVLREVARRGSLAGAADVLSYTPSAVSQQIAALEREAGMRLLERRARGVVLTEAGQSSWSTRR